MESRRPTAPPSLAASSASPQMLGATSAPIVTTRRQQLAQLPLQGRSRRLVQLVVGTLVLHFAWGWTSALSHGTSVALVAASTNSGRAAKNKAADEDAPDGAKGAAELDLGVLGAAGLAVVGAACWGSALRTAKALRTREEAGDGVAAAPAGVQGKKKPRIDSFDSLRFFLIAYIASGHFIHTATKNAYLLKLISQINVVVGAFFVLSGYVAAYTTTELGERKGSKRLDNAVEFAVTRIMGFWPLHFLVLVLFGPMFMWVDFNFSGPLVATWHGVISTALLQAWFPMSAEVWNAPTWFLSAFAFSLCVLPYALRVLATQKKSELRRTLAFLTLFSLIPKVSYSYDLKSWDIMEGTLNARTHPNYALFNSLRFNPFGAILEVLMGAAACRLVMLDDEKDAGNTGSPLLPLISMFGIITLRAADLVTMNDMLVRSAFFIPLWISFLMRIHRQSVGPGGAQKILPKVLCNPGLLYLGSISFPIFIVHGPIGQVFYKKAVATKLFGGNLANPQPTGFHWFFGVYWAVVLCTAAVLQKGFVESKKVKEASTALGTAIVKALTN